MDRSEIVRRVVQVMEDTFDVDDIDYRDSLSAADFEDWDSLSNIRFVVAVEKEFGVRFANSEVEDLANVGEMVDLIAAKSA